MKEIGSLVLPFRLVDVEVGVLPLYLFELHFHLEKLKLVFLHHFGIVLNFLALEYFVFVSQLLRLLLLLEDVLLRLFPLHFVVFGRRMFAHLQILLQLFLQLLVQLYQG